MAGRAPPADAVRELLALAEAADGQIRLAAVALAERAGPEAVAAWRESSTRPGFGAYARQWLAERGGPVEPVTEDEAWLTADALAMTLSQLPPGLPTMMLTGLLGQELAGADPAEVIGPLRTCGHPAADRIIDLLEEATRPTPVQLTGDEVIRQMLGHAELIPAPRQARETSSGSRPRAGAAHRLKVSLRGVSKPPVWRRVLVPADIRLDELHEVILAVMGWHGGHLHVFEREWEEYGVPDPELGHSDERQVRLWELIGTPGDKLRYTYDFGDHWEHDIALEGVVMPEPGQRLPHCVTGKGACPPEDCGGPWGYADLKAILADPGHEQHEEMLGWLSLDSAQGFDPREFSADRVNAWLARRLGG